EKTDLARWLFCPVKSTDKAGMMRIEMTVFFRVGTSAIWLGAFALIALGLTACAASGPLAYGPAEKGRFGYSEVPLETGRYRVSYAGSARMSPDEVEQLALRRAAELTITDGFDWFRVVNRDLNGDERGGVSVGGGVGSGRVGRRSGVGVGVGGNLGTVGAQRYFTVRLEILMGRDAAPDDPNIYDARDVLAAAADAPFAGTQ
ncbi:MAG: hypothetical protein AAGH42_13795, partial [Pseudomonadota bacterium]